VKRALLIVAAIAGYSLLETAILMSTIVPRDLLTSTGRYGSVVALCQLLIIPGLALLFSRIIYGQRKLVRRAFVGLLIGPLALYVFTAPFGALATVPNSKFRRSEILWGMILFVLIATAFGWCVRRLRRWNVEAEAERWLAARQSQPSERRWHTRGIRAAVCIPAATVLVVFLFFPETSGLISHLASRHLGDLSGYHVSVPMNWIVQYRFELPNGRSVVAGFSEPGMALGGNPFRYRSFSHWGVYTVSFSKPDPWDDARWLPKDEYVIGRREVALGREHLQCVDYRSGSQNPGGDADTGAVAHIYCSGSMRLRADFDGPRAQLPKFYRVLSEIRSR
jgi:hypothetical protein